MHNYFFCYTAKLFFVSLFSVLLFSCHKKEEDQAPEKANTQTYYMSEISSYCKLVTSCSSDTNYIPHKKNNYWSFCTTNMNVANKDASVVRDTIIQNKVYFDVHIDFNTAHSSITAWTDKYIIDSLGSYYSISPFYPNDTLLIIDPKALNSDTIYNNPITHSKVVLINKMATYQNLTNCYHTRIIRGSSSPENHYYKKGLGDLNYGGTGTLWTYTIH